MNKQTPGLSRRNFTGLAGLAPVALACPAVLRAAEPIRLRASVDTSPSHGRTISIADYLKKVEAASDGQIKTELFASGQLFPDRDVSKALVQGQIEMGVPGLWVLTAFVPDCDMVNLPVLYSRSIDFTHAVVDGKPGQLVNDQLEAKLKVKVLGPWIDLGFSNWYSTAKPLNSVADLAGMKLRNSGGAAQAWRGTYFNAIPNNTPWPDVPLALSQGTFDGLSSTDESVASASLWEAGVRFALEDHQNFAEYVPMVSGRFWGGLTPALQKIMVDTWAANIPTYRTNMAAAQTRALKTMGDHGIKIVIPTVAEMDQVRAKMITQQAEAARVFKVRPELVTEIDAVAAKVG